MNSRMKSISLIFFTVFAIKLYAPYTPCHSGSNYAIDFGKLCPCVNGSIDCSKEPWKPKNTGAGNVAQEKFNFKK